MSTQRTHRPERCRAVGYVRRSTDRQEQSTADQKQALEAYAGEHGLRLGKFYIDDAISGTSTVGRRAFREMMQDAAKAEGSFDLIVVYDVKRFGRVDNDEAGYYRHVLRTHGVEVRYASENFNGDATDDLLRPVKQWQARQESKDLSKVTIRGLLSKVATKGGWWMGGVPPLGYDLRYESNSGEFLCILRYMQDGSKQVLSASGERTRTLARGESLSTSKRDRAKLVPGSPERIKTIQHIFHLYTEQGKGYRSVADTLNQEGIPTARGPEWSKIYSGEWTDTTIRSLLVNQAYVGDMIWNRRTDARFHKIQAGCAAERGRVHASRLVPNDESDWIIVPDAHPALISRRVFEQAKQKRENQPSSIEQRGRNSRLKTHGKTWRGRRSRFILSGLLTCAKCGSRYQGITQGRGKNLEDGARVVTSSYACGGYITKGNRICEMNPIPQQDLETLVIDAVVGFYKPCLERGGREKIVAIVRKQMGCDNEELVAARARAEEEQQRVGGSINNLLDNITADNREFVDGRLKELNDQRKQLELRIAELDRLAASQAEINSIVTEALQFISGLKFTLNQGLPQEKLCALRQCVERILINKPARSVIVKIKAVPASSIQEVEELARELAPVDAVVPQ